MNSKPLDLYAKVEDLLGVKEVCSVLYAHYFLFLNSEEFSSLLDVGCGSGNFLIQMQNALNIKTIKGIDLSPVMIDRAEKKNIDVECIDLCNTHITYDVITAVFDVLNYLDKLSLKRFLMCVNNNLNTNGIFLCDINTLYGFQEVAVGSYIVDDNERFLTIDSDFENYEYISDFTLFEKKENLYTKSQESIRQYYHTVDDLVKYSGLELVSFSEVNLYGLEESDKTFIVLRKI